MIERFFREVRRLSLIRLVCETVLERGTYELEILGRRIVEKSKRINATLSNYSRSTGKIETLSVALSHVRVCGSLSLLKLGGRFVESTSLAGLLKGLSVNEDNRTTLTREEKLFFFEHLLSRRIQTIHSLLSRLNLRKSADFQELKNAVRDDHVKKSHTEWLIDLGLVAPTLKKKGYFFLSKVGRPLAETCFSGPEESVSIPTCTMLFAGSLTGSKITSSPTVDEILEALNASIKRYRPIAESPLGDQVLSAFPVLMAARFSLILEHQKFISLEELIGQLERVLPEKGIRFKWDPMYQGGHIEARDLE